MGKAGSRVAPASTQCWDASHLLGQLKEDLLASSCTNQYQQYFTLENPLSLEDLGLNAFKIPL